MENEKIKIHTEGTPNPNALKFIVNRIILENTSMNFPAVEKSKDSPLAEKLFRIHNVEEIFFGRDFITILKNQAAGWEGIYEKAIEIITDHLSSGEQIVLNMELKKQIISNETEQKIHEILDNQIRPAVASDGGDVIFDSYEDGILRLHLQGSCSHCPSSIMTLKAGIEALLKREIPELKEVVSI